MSKILPLIFVTCMVMTSCRQPEKSKEMMARATAVYVNFHLSPDIRVDSSLVLTDSALALDNKNITALTHKTALMLRKKDLNAAIDITDRLIQLIPEKPFYIGQKAVYLEAKGDSAEARKYYDLALNRYRKSLATEGINFDVMLEYVQALELSGDTLLANNTLLEMEDMGFEEYQQETLDLFKGQRLSKVQVMKYLRGEIDYEQLTEGASD